MFPRLRSYLHRRTLFRLIALLLPFVLFLLAGEIVLRVRGLTPFSLSPENFVVEPGGRFYAAHPRLGYTLMPGHFRVTLPDGYSFEATHTEDAHRLTHPVRAAATDGRTGVWIFGCSFTHGWGLNDAETYPWLLQEKLPRHEVVNFGTEGYGTIQGLIQFQEALQRETPEVAIIAYASFHDERNTFSRQTRKLAVIYNKLGPTIQPYVRLNQQNLLDYYFTSTDEITYTEFPLMRYSSLMSYIEIRYNQLDARFNRSHEASKALIREFANLCSQRNIKLVVAGIVSDPQTSDMLEYCKGLGISTLDMSVDLTKKENTNWPHDLHPSKLATEVYASRLASFLSNNVLSMEEN
jgi:hypothetical protein